MSLFDWLPAFPWEGPPLPRFLAIAWPWVGQQSLSLPKLPSLRQYVTSVKETYQAPAVGTYQNEESWDIDWSPDGLPTRIKVHRNARRE